jgi:hypothetical protein
MWKLDVGTSIGFITVTRINPSVFIEHKNNCKRVASGNPFAWFVIYQSKIFNILF